MTTDHVNSRDWWPWIPARGRCAALAGTTKLELGRRARARDERRMPAAHLRAIVGKGTAGEFHEIERDEPGDVRDGEALAAHERPLRELLLERRQEFQRAGPVRLGPGGDLRHFHARHHRMRVPEAMADRGHQ